MLEPMRISIIIIIARIGYGTTSVRWMHARADLDVVIFQLPFVVVGMGGGLLAAT